MGDFGSRNVPAKVRSNDVWKAIERAFEDHGIDRYEVFDERPHPRVVFVVDGRTAEMHFPGTPGSTFCATETAGKIRRLIRTTKDFAALDAAMGIVPDGVAPSEIVAVEEAQRRAVVFERDGEVFANSRDVAASFGKNHRDVIRAIDNIAEQKPELCLRNFALTSIEVPMPNGGTREDRCYDMDRDGFSLLVMGFTGKKALEWKLRYIEAFNSMERELRSRSHSTPDLVKALADPNTVRAVLLNYAEKVIALEGEVAAQKPKVEALNRIAAADGSMCITDAAKTLQLKPKGLFEWLRANGWVYSRPGSSLIGYQTKLALGYLEHKTTTIIRPDGSEKITTQCRITPKGLTRLAQEFQTELLPVG